MDDSRKTEKEPLAEGRATQPRKAKLKRGSQDISVLKKAEEALRESEERYHAIFEQAADAVVICDAETKEMVEFNNKAYQNLGYSRKEFQRLRLSDIEADESAEEITKHIEKIIREGMDTFEAKHKTKHGEIRDVLISAKVIHIKGKDLIQGIWRDITERKRTEEALKRERDFSQNLINTAQAIVLVLDTEGRIVSFNPYMEELSGYCLEEVKGKDWFTTFLPECDYDRTREVFKKALSDIQTRGNVNPIVTKDGKQRLIEWYDKTLKDNSGNVIGLLTIGQDITKRKKTEEELKASLKDKEVLVSEIHHRVKNNLQVISSLFKLQSEYIRDKPMLEMLKQSQNRIRTMALIHEKLYQSKDLVKIDFADYIRSLTTYLFRLYEVSSDAIALKIEAAEVSLGIDTAIPCGLIISELVSNSLKHAFPAGKEGQIRIEFHSDKDNQFTLIVSDNGVGLPKAMDFRKAESLGLQLVNMLTGQLGGAIELDRSDGTTFKITFTEPQEGKDVI
ncbi:MAG TPA: PAS domain S-box protein [Sedimentisphaerales bacterium]|nr:PAS domain S-box protein [Sedimentisphaerales bacterium]